MSEPLLEIENLHLDIRTADGLAEILQGIDLSVESGETVALVGETGCGKSITAKSVMGLLPETATIPTGSLQFRGEDLLALPEKERNAYRGKQMGMIMQDPMTALNPVFTVGDYMTDVMKWQGTYKLGLSDWLSSKFTSNDSLRERAIEMLEEVQIAAPERVFESYPVELSGGMRQRVLIATALLSEPELLIADEPGTALDLTTEAKILELLQDLIDEKDMSVIYITHDLSIAKYISDTIYVMYAGEIVERAPAEELFDNPQHPYTIGLLDSIPSLSKPIGEGIAGELPDTLDRPQNCQFADRCPYSEPECREIYPARRETAPDHEVGCHLYTPEDAAAFDGELVDIGTPPAREQLENET